MQLVKCDKCGIVMPPKKKYVRQPEDWFYLTYKVNSYTNVEYDLCYGCGTKMGLKKEEMDPATVGDQLLSLIEEVAQEAVSQ